MEPLQEDELGELWEMAYQRARMLYFDHPTSEDIAQDVMIKVWQQCEKRDNLANYVRKSTRNRAIDMQRHLLRKSAPLPLIEAMTGSEDLVLPSAALREALVPVLGSDTYQWMLDYIEARRRHVPPAKPIERLRFHRAKLKARAELSRLRQAI